MDNLKHTIAELMDVPMEDWPEWIECRGMRTDERRAIEAWLVGPDAQASDPLPGTW